MTQLIDQPTDQCIVLSGNWDQFKRLQQVVEETSKHKLSYYNEAIQILMTSRTHETVKSMIGFFMTTFLVDRNIWFKPTGGMTQEKEGEVSAQADQSYFFDQSSLIPELSIEAIFVCNSKSRLRLYQALEASEVWFWENESFALHHLRKDGYEPIERSQLPGLQDLDIDLLTRCVLIIEDSCLEAARLFRREIEKRDGDRQ